MQKQVECLPHSTVSTSEGIVTNDLAKVGKTTAEAFLESFCWNMVCVWQGREGQQGECVPPPHKVG
jgi:hypothetical protein